MTKKILSTLLICISMSIFYKGFSQNAPIRFSFKIDKASTTSAGVYKRDGTLVRTLWNNIRYSAGTHQAIWNRKDDEGKIINDTGYVFKVISNNIKYTWEGTIGNNSDSLTGSSKIRAFERFNSMAVAGNYAYYSIGYSEGVPSCYKLDVRKPHNKINILFEDENNVDLQCDYVATDGQLVYWTGYDPFAPGTSFIFATNVSDDSEYVFPNGNQKATKFGRTYNSVINLYQNDSNSHPSGIAVQKNGDFLFIAHKNLNKISVFNKKDGSLIRQMNVSNPREICIYGNELWMISQANTISKHSIETDGSIGAPMISISGLSEPLALAISTGNKEILILDGGISQQIKAYSTLNGQMAWSLGSQGGYMNNPEVNDYKFYFNDSTTMLTKPFIAFQEDSSFWVGDPGNERVMHYSSSGVFKESIMCLPHSYSTVVDRNNPSRVFNEYLEYEIDYGKPLGPQNGSWKLKRNWRRGIKPSHFQNDKLRIFIQCITLSNGRTYAILDEYVNKIRKPEIVELPSSGNIRYTGIKLRDFAQDIITPEGHLRRLISSTNIGDSGYWEVQNLINFINGNPVWDVPVKTAFLPKIKATDPAAIVFASPVVTQTGINVIFNPSKDHKGYHLGAIRNGSDRYLWRTSPSTHRQYTGPMPTDGTFDIGNGVEYAGGNVYALEQSIFWNYHGEFWKNSQTNIWNHYYDNGLMLGQFGITTPEGESIQKEAFAEGAGNVFSSTLVRHGNDYYIYHNDESVHGGVHRWKISGLNSISEQIIEISFTPLKNGGLKGSYFEGNQLDPLKINSYRIDSSFSKLKPPQTISDKNNFSVEFSAFLKVETDGNYTFEISGDKGFRFHFNDTLSISEWNGNSEKTIETKSFQLKRGQFYPIKLETQSLNIEVRYRLEKTAYIEIPAKSLYPDLETQTLDIDLMSGIKYAEPLQSGIYGWERFPANDDLHWKIETGIKSYKRSHPDVQLTATINDSTFFLRRHLQSIRLCDDSWGISGNINLEENSPQINDIGLHIIIRDVENRILCKFSHKILLIEELNYPTYLLCNDNIIIGEPYERLKIRTSKNPGFKISFSDQGLLVEFDGIVPSNFNYFDPDADWRSPAFMDIQVQGVPSGEDRQISLATLKLHGSSYIPLTISGKDSICENETISLSSNINRNVKWNTGSEEANILIRESGQFYLNSTIGSCLASSDTFISSVSEIPKPIIGRKGDRLFSNFEDGNIWILNGVEQGTADTLNITNKGTYKLKVQTEAGCEGETSMEVQELEIESFSIDGQLVCFPNPSVGIVQIRSITHEGIVEVIDSRGIVMERFHLNPKEDKIIRIENGGIYLIRVRNNGHNYVKKLIVL